MINSINSNVIGSSYTGKLNAYGNASTAFNKGGLYGNYSVHNDLKASYGVNTATGTRTTNTDIKENGNKISELLNTLSDKSSKSVFNSYSVSASDSNAVSATLDQSKFSQSKISPINLNVQQVAKAQTNSGDAISASGKAVSTGNYSFSIESNGKKHDFSINVSATDDNKSIQQKMADAINSKEIGVTASAVYNSTNKTTKLSITGDKTGVGTNLAALSSFNITDKAGQLASKMGITKVSNQAQNAVYSVNGQEKTSASNNIDLGNGVTATLKNAGKSTLNYAKNGSNAVDKVKSLVETFNSALKKSNELQGAGTSRLSKDISDMTKTYSKSLSEIGINVFSDGSMKIDETKLNSAASNGKLQKMFQTDASYGFASRADRIADNMSKSNYYADYETNPSSSASSKSSYSSLYGMYSKNYTAMQYFAAGSYLDMFT